MWSSPNGALYASIRLSSNVSPSTERRAGNRSGVQCGNGPLTGLGIIKSTDAPPGAVACSLKLEARRGKAGRWTGADAAVIGHMQPCSFDDAELVPWLINLRAGCRIEGGQMDKSLWFICLAAKSITGAHEALQRGGQQHAGYLLKVRICGGGVGRSQSDS